MEERTGWRGQNESQTVGEEKWQTCWCCRDQQRAYRMAQASAEKIGTNWACRKGKSGLSATERAVGKYAGAAFAKRKRNKAVCPKHQFMRGKEVKVGESRTLARERRSKREHEAESVNFTMKEGRFQGGKGGQATRASQGEVGGSISV